MRILFATYWYLPHVGGVNTYVYALKKELEENGHQVDILAHHPDMDKIYLYRHDHQNFGWAVDGKQIHKPRIKDIVYDAVFNYFRQYNSHVEPWIRWREIERYTFELAATLFDLEQYDLIHTQDIISTRALWRVKPKHVPLVATLHGLLANEHIFTGDITSKDDQRWEYVKAEEFYGAISSDYTIVPTKWLGGELSQHFGVPDSKLNVIPYGMELESFMEKMKYQPSPPLSTNTNQIKIAFPARLHAPKGHKTLIDALALIKKIRNDFVCWFIGDGKLSFELEKYCQEKGVMDHVLYLGNRYDVPALLNKADIVVQPALEDNHPFAIMEAQVAGKAIVASDAGGLPEMVEDGVTGLLFKRGDRLLLADKLLELMNNERLRSRLETNSKNWGRQHWSAKTLYERTLQVYHQVLSSDRDVASQVDGDSGANASTSVDPVFYGKDDLHKFFINNKEQPPLWSTIFERIHSTYSIPDVSYWIDPKTRIGKN